jgi:hypothetical protein
MRKLKEFYAPYGLQYEQPPAKSFQEIAHERSGVLRNREMNSFHLLRIRFCVVVDRQLNRLLDSPVDGVARNSVTRKAWAELQETLAKISEREADLILASIPFYVTPGNEPLDPTCVCPLIWPLSVVGLSRLVSPVQKQFAQKALFQIGARANLRIATELAKYSFTCHTETYHQAQILHYTWHV